MSEFSGIYEMAEAARYLHVTAPRRPPNYAAVRRWVRSGLPDPETITRPATELILSFEDLISLRMVVALRIAGFSLQHIRRVHADLRRITGYPHPFAIKDLWVSNTDIFVQMNGWLSVTKRGTYAMEFVKDWLREIRRPIDDTLDIGFKRTDGHEVAAKWSPYPNVLLNPLVQFGTPCIEGTRIPTGTVWDMYRAGDRPQAIANNYRVSITQIESALEWEKELAHIA
ncbi:MAG: DUF433 domain-containing protein [Chloroflexi bacterium]|nr:DUF433 domain-containing protein [Chloroflexota bacterium]